MIRRARLDDAPALAALNERTVWATYGPHVAGEKIASVAEWMPERWRERLAGAGGPRSEVWVLERDGAIGGWVTVGEARDADARAGDGELWALYVDPDRVGAGDGGPLEAHAVQRLRELGFAAATLWVMAYNERAIGFYRHRGWAPDDRQGTNPYAGWGPALRMRRTLGER